MPDTTRASARPGNTFRHRDKLCFIVEICFPIPQKAGMPVRHNPAVAIFPAGDELSTFHEVFPFFRYIRFSGGRLSIRFLL